MKTVELNEAERMAINQFISENWEEFKATAELFLDEVEIELLDSKLEGKD